VYDEMLGNVEQVDVWRPARPIRAPARSARIFAFTCAFAGCLTALALIAVVMLTTNLFAAALAAALGSTLGTAFNVAHRRLRASIDDECRLAEATRELVQASSENNVLVDADDPGYAGVPVVVEKFLFRTRLALLVSAALTLIIGAVVNPFLGVNWVEYTVYLQVCIAAVSGVYLGNKALEASRNATWGP